VPPVLDPNGEPEGGDLPARELGWIAEAAGGDPERRATLIGRRRAGEPLQYVLGEWSFRSLDLICDPRVLIPRPETEQVVEVALGRLGELVGTKVGSGDTKGAPVRCLDLGTGSGAIALSLAVEVPDLLAGRLGPGGSPATPVGVEVWAVDRSAEALEVATLNRDRLLGRVPEITRNVHFALGSWFEPLPAALHHGFDLVVANPPYVSGREFVDLDDEVRLWEPTGALVADDGVSGVGGLFEIETILGQVETWLVPGGVVVIELSPPQAYAAIDVARRSSLVLPVVERDLAGRLRMLVAFRRA
jgi:release factor glutamine methyltransferase